MVSHLMIYRKLNIENKLKNGGQYETRKNQ